MRTTVNLKVWGVILAGALCATFDAKGAAYSLIDLGTLGGPTSFAYAINDSGQVVGSATLPLENAFAGNHAFIYQNGTMTALGDPSGSGGSVAVAISATGKAVGYSVTNPFAFSSFARAVIWQDGLVGSFGGPMANAFNGISNGTLAGVNSAGQITGNYSKGAFIFQNNLLTDLGGISGPAGISYAQGINESGQVGGYSEGHAFLYTNGVMSDLGSLGGNSYGVAINASGEIAGISYLPDGVTPHATLFDHGSIVDLHGLGTKSEAFAINNAGQIVGNYWSTGGSSTFRAFLYQAGNIIDLNNAIAPDSSFTLQSAQGINNSGQIVGYGINSLGQTHAFLLTPIPEPTSTAWIGLLIGCSVLLSRTRRCAR